MTRRVQKKLYLMLIEREEEEIGGRPVSSDAFGLADAGARAVSHRAVAFHLADAGARAVSHRAVAFHLTDARSRAVADGAVAVNLADARA